MIGRKWGAALAGTALALGGVAVSATPAAAGTACTNETLGTGSTGQQHVYVNNHCVGPVNVRVIWDWAHDSPCTTINAGTTKKFWPGQSFGRFNRVESC